MRRAFRLTSILLVSLDAMLVPHMYRLLDFRTIRYRVVIGSPIPCEAQDRKNLARTSREKVLGLGEISDRQGCRLPGDLI